MKKEIRKLLICNLLLIFFSVSAICQNRVGLDKLDSYYFNGNLVQYYTSDNAIVAMSVNTTYFYGNYYVVNISIHNNTDKRCDFLPSDVYAFYKNGDKRKNAQALSLQAFKKKIRRKQQVEEILLGLSMQVEAFNNSVFVNATSTTTTTVKNEFGYNIATIESRTKDYGELNRRNMENYNNLHSLEAQHIEAANSVDAGYLQRHTIFPHEELSGYMCIPYKNTDELIINIRFGNNLYGFRWMFEKQKNRKRLGKWGDDVYN